MPPDLVLTEQIPDLVIIDRSDTPAKVVLIELTVPWDSANSFKAAEERKTARYERLAGDLRDKGLITFNLPIFILKVWHWHLQPKRKIQIISSVQ